MMFAMWQALLILSGEVIDDGVVAGLKLSLNARAFGGDFNHLRSSPECHH